MAAISSIESKRCWSCGNTSEAGKKLPRCSKCHEAIYCNVGCQKAHWPEHKKVCATATVESGRTAAAAAAVLSPKSAAELPPTTSGFLLFPQVWEHALKTRVAKESGSTVLILGPGLFRYDGKKYSPQVSEAIALLGGHDRTIAFIDCNSEVLEAAQDMARTDVNPLLITTFEGNHFQGCPLVRAALDKRKGGNVTLQPIKMTFGRERLPPDFPKADLVLSTFVLSHAFNPYLEDGVDLFGEKRVELLGEYIGFVKPGKCMYVDEGTLKAALLNTPFSDLSERSVFPRELEVLKGMIQQHCKMEVEFEYLPVVQGIKKSDSIDCVAQLADASEKYAGKKTSGAFAIWRRSEKSR